MNYLQFSILSLIPLLYYFFSPSLSVKLRTRKYPLVKGKRIPNGKEYRAAVQEGTAKVCPFLLNVDNILSIAVSGPDI
jgi:hypothetical protein